MTAPQSPDDEDESTSEDRFARQDINKYGHRSSAVTLLAIIVTIAVVFIYLAMRRTD